ncbi:MAG: LON peptidase substrate-binding domain-containing protein, partial [Planctomycetota bacterium]
MTAISNNWLIDLEAEEPAGFEPYLYDDDNQSQVSSHKLKLPDVIGILPIRNAVAYPGTVTPLAIGRKKSKALIAEIVPNESIIGLLTQRDPEIDRPGFDNLYSV